ncbi:MAG: rhodanese-like domain-containing protein [Verrucomicrobiaceae bacterium]|nr:MAG: rhodanese-like domain-containing protein [Verrucomicrobiaceae bacterium]
MKTTFLSGILAATAFPLFGQQVRIHNPAIDYEVFSRLTAKIAPIREKNRVTEEVFIAMAAEPGTVVLDARTRNLFENIHIKGAIHLALTDFTEEALLKVIPDKSTRILIYCNNNFENEPEFFAGKFATVALNIQTFINLHAYGYKNVYELGPLLDVNTTRIPFKRKPGYVPFPRPRALPASQTPTVPK